MINIKNIFKVLLIALFVCAYSGEVYSESYRGESRADARSPKGKSQHQCSDNFSCGKGQKCDNGNCVAADVEVSGAGGKNSADFCSSDQGIFTDLVSTGVKIFKQLRDLIYVVAGFGIIAVAVGGFFGNLNWKWLGAIIISLVVIATAGELVVLLTGCETFGSSLITNTLTNPTPMTTKDYNEKFTEDAEDVNNVWINNWNDEQEPASSGSSNDESNVPEDGI
jgi:hypothetical protein